MWGVDWINQWADVWAKVIYARVLDTTLVFLFVGFLWFCLRRKMSAQFGYLLFLLVLLKIIMPMQLSIPGLLSYWFPPTVQENRIGIGGFDWFGTGIGNGLKTPDEAIKTVSKETASASPGSAIHFSTLFMCIWIIGVLISLLHQVWVEWKTQFMMRNTIALDPKRIPIDLHELQATAGIKRKVKWVTGHWVQSPVAFGYFHPMIAVPSDIAHHYTVRQLRWILLHELAHIKRYDAFAFLLQRILQSLFFFHPFVWWTNALIDQLREYACDDAALAGSQSSPQECGEGFLGVVMQSNGLPTFLLATHGLIDYKTTIRRRLMRILDRKHNRQTKVSLLSNCILCMLAILVIPFSWNAADAQVGEWIKVEGNPAPTSRAMHGMIYDSARDVILLHGGWPVEGYALNDTWEMKGTTKEWANVSNDGPALFGFGIAYDSVRAVTVLSGGYPAFQRFENAQTWEWDSRTWKNIHTEEKAVCFPAMAYHPIRKTAIRHGGMTDITRTPISETVEWDGNQWKPLPDGPPLALHRMVYDSVRNKMVVFGGIKGMGIISNETWEFDGETWKKVADTGPVGREVFGMVFDSNWGVTILFGGGLYVTQGFNQDFIFNDLWQWDGSKWSQLLLEGISEYNAYQEMTFDPKRDQIVLFGGAASPESFRPNDTWILRFSLSGIPFRFWSKY